MRIEFFKSVAPMALSFIFYGCIGEDVIEDFVEAELRIDNPISEIQVDTQHTFQATYFNNVGLPENIAVAWSSSNEDILSINENGVATAHSEGSAIIIASVNSQNGLIEDQDSIDVKQEEVSTNSETNTKQGAIITTSGYRLEGSFEITSNGDDLVLDVADDYVASSSLPGLYVYLTNNPSSINGAFEIGPVEVFNGAHTYRIQDVGINDFSYLLYWCKPFTVKVGGGDILED